MPQPSTALRQDTRTGGGAAANVARFCVEVLFLCFPALINRAALVYSDTRAYFLGGHAAVEKIAGLFAHGSGGGGDALQATMQKARGIRSAFYSLFAYLPAITVSLWLVVLLQAMIVAAMLRLVLRLSRPDRDGWRATAFTVLLAVFTTVSWATCNVMPDIFTGVMALGIIVCVVFSDRLSVVATVAMFLAIAGSMVMHLTNLPIGLGLLVVGTLFRTGHARFRGRPVAVVGGALAAGALAMLAVGVVGFKQWTLAPQSPPFFTARSIMDGPGRLYLRAHCPAVGLAMCGHLDKLDQPTPTFIWDKDGVYSAVPPDEQARLRAEDKRLYLAAALEHPWLQAGAIARNAVAQLFNFGMQEYYIPSGADYTSDDMTLHIPDSVWHAPVTVLEYVVVFGAMGFIVGTWRRHSTTERHLVVMVLATVLIEAMAGAFSEPVPRYEARVMWLVPMTGLLLWGNRYRGARGIAGGVGRSASRA